MRPAFASSALRLGPIRVDPPVILAPMAGVTDYPFRALCRSFGAGLFVSEMVTARPLVEGSRKTRRIASFGPDEWPRSIQLYGTDPEFLGRAVTRLREGERVDHIDLNFGCPVPKVTRRGGGAAVPYKRTLLRRLVREAVHRAGPIPVTMKVRIGLDDDHVTYLDAGRIAEDEGCAAIALHARTAAQFYAGSARWSAIAALKAHVAIPVLGNGDIWEAHDALRMMDETGCDGVVVGRGCLGRPWLFRELAAALGGRKIPPPPTLGEVARIMRTHAAALAAWSGPHGLRSFRKHATWYIKGFSGSARLRSALMTVETLEDLDRVLATVNPEEPFPTAALRIPRGKSGGRRKVVLPAGFLADRGDAWIPESRQVHDGG